MSHKVIKEDGLQYVICDDCGRKTSFSKHAPPDELCCVHCEDLTTASDDCGCEE